jgi:type I restriction enzyme R subunit
MSDLKEKDLEEFIEEHLVNTNKYTPRNYTVYNKEQCCDEELLFQFLETTQKEKFDRLHERVGSDFKRRFVRRLFKKIGTNGIVNVLRDGISENGIKFDLIYDKPQTTNNPQSLELFNNNIFSTVRQLHYSTKNNNSLDTVIFVNGIPIITIELKNEFTGQTVYNAMKQYREDRDPREELFKFGRCLVHFAVDSELIFMTTKLNGEKTFFLPFNKGLNSGSGEIDIPKGAGNPPSYGVKTAYLWENILEKETLTKLIINYVQMFDEIDPKTKKVVDTKLIFPRFHQFDVVNRLLQNCKDNGVGNRYLIQHSAGSGKSNSISWLAHQLTGLHNDDNELVFDTVIVVTDRTVLDKQIQENIKQFHHTKGVVKPITKGSIQLKESLEEGKKIIISTIQKFPYIVNDIGELRSKKFAIIIDEAHSSQSGSTAQKLGETIRDTDGDETSDEDKIVEIIRNKKLQSNASYFAFTATPKPKTMELFGQEIEYNGEQKFIPFHLYSMKQAIEEGFILDVLKGYTTYKSYYHLETMVENDPQYDKKRANAKLKKYVESNEVAIGKKAEIMIDHFNTHTRKKIKNRAKSMVVTSSRQNAIRYYFAFKEYLKQINSQFKVLVAFSGEIEVDGIKYTETGLNGIAETKLKENFKSDEYRFLIVANKYQTGFDEPLLHTMYVDKKLGGVSAVQTLSRLNRTTANKEDTFVMDFFNSHEDIEVAFSKFYETTYLKEQTDPNKIFDLMDSLNDFQIYSSDDIDELTTAILNKEKENVIHPILDRVKAEYEERSEDEQVDFLQKTKSYLRLYSFLSQILPYDDHTDLEKLYILLKKLSTKIKPKTSEDLSYGILDNVDFDSYRVQLDKKADITLGGNGELTPSNADGTGGKPEPELDLLSNIIQGFNDKFGDIDWGEDDKIKRVLNNISDDVISDTEFIKSTQNADRQNMRITFDKVLEDKFQDIIETNFLLFQRFNDDPEFKEFVSTKMFEFVNHNINCNTQNY